VQAPLVVAPRSDRQDIAFGSGVPHDEATRNARACKEVVGRLGCAIPLIFFTVELKIETVCA